MSRDILLGLDTSGPHCAVSLWHNGETILDRTVEMKRGQAEKILGLAQDLLIEADLNFNDVTCLAVGVGPGNFTGIRIAVAAARGLALSSKLPIISVSTFDLNRAEVVDRDERYIVTVAAPQDKLYTQMYDAGRPVGQARLANLDDIDTDGIAFAVGPLSERIHTFAHPVPETSVSSRLGLMSGHAFRTFGYPKDAPKPLYIKPADAAPSKDQPPKLLNHG